MPFSDWLLSHRVAKHPAALERIRLAKERILSVLDREIVANGKSLEQKIADQGPATMRVDPHLISLAVDDMGHLNRIAVHTQQVTKNTPWYSNIGTSKEVVEQKLETLAPLYATISQKMTNVIGDALEIATFQALTQTRAAMPRYHFDGHFYLDQPKNEHGRFLQRKATTEINGRSTSKQPDFLQHGHNSGTVCIECKNYREWLYPRQRYIKHHIRRCYELDTIPVFVVRRIHYTTRTNFFAPAGIIAHETYYQYMPSDCADIADQARHKRSLGFTDLLASEEPHARTVKFFSVDLPKIVEPMAVLWKANKETLFQYATEQINLAQLYTAISSPAGGKWTEAEEPEIPEEW